jgi:hypothetical protein
MILYHIKTYCAVKVSILDLIYFGFIIASALDLGAYLFIDVCNIDVKDLARRTRNGWFAISSGATTNSSGLSKT